MNHVGCIFQEWGAYLQNSESFFCLAVLAVTLLTILAPADIFRYRQRKRAELDSLEEQLHGLEGRNRELRDKAESVEREIQYVKDLLIEVYKARSQRLKQDTNA